MPVISMIVYLYGIIDRELIKYFLTTNLIQAMRLRLFLQRAIKVNSFSAKCTHPRSASFHKKSFDDFIVCSSDSYYEPFRVSIKKYDLCKKKK